MKRILSVILVLLMGLAGCQSQDIPAYTLAEASGRALEVVTSYGGDDGNRRNFLDAVESYEEKYGIEVADSSSVSNEEWKSSVLTDFMTGSEPDVLFYFVGADADPFIHADKVVSVEEIRQKYPQYAKNMKEDMIPAAQNGMHYAVPSTGFWETMFANRKVLHACGVEEPGPDYSWQQFLADCAKIKAQGYTPIACSLFEIPHYWFEFMVMNHGSSENQLELPSLDENGMLVDDAASRKWIQGLEDIKQLYELGYFPENTLTASDAQTVSMFAEGEAAFLIDGSWKVGFFTENYPDKMDDILVTYVPAQGERKASDVLGGISMGYFITRKAWENPEKQQAAVDFVSHMTSDDVLSTFVTTEMTALTFGAHPRGLNPIQKSAADVNRHVTSFSSAVQDSMSGEAKSELFSNIQKVVTGKMSAEKAVQLAMKLG